MHLFAARLADVVDEAGDRAGPEQVGNAAANELEAIDAEVVAIVDVIGRRVEAERAEHGNAVVHQRRELVLAAEAGP